MDELRLREVVAEDLPVFYRNQLDPEANRMAAFTAADPADRVAFDAHWKRLLQDGSVFVRTIHWSGEVAGSVLSFQVEGGREVSYRIGRRYWGKGVATRALAAFLEEERARPLHGRAAKDNLASIRVLEKCGFTVVGEERGFANARREEIDELVLRLDA